VVDAKDIVTGLAVGYGYGRMSPAQRKTINKAVITAARKQFPKLLRVAAMTPHGRAIVAGITLAELFFD